MLRLMLNEHSRLHVPAARHTSTTVPNKLFDYMACAIPVLASDTPPVQRIVQTEECGVIYSFDHPEDFTENLKKLRSPEIRREMGSNGRRAVETKYNREVDSRVLLEAVESR